MATEKKDTAPKEAPAKEVLKLKADQVYTLVGTGKSLNMPKGSIFEGVAGAEAELIINAGKATLKA